MVGLAGVLSRMLGGYWVLALVSKFLRLGNFLKPIMGLSLKIGPQSGLFSIIFQFLWIISLIFGLHGL